MYLSIGHIIKRTEKKMKLEKKKSKRNEMMKSLISPYIFCNMSLIRVKKVNEWRLKEERLGLKQHQVMNISESFVLKK